MFTSFALLLPFCICVLSALVFMFKRHKYASQQFVLVINILCSAYYFADTMLLGDSISGVFAIIGSVVCQFVGPMILPLYLLMTRSMMRSNYYSWTTGFWFTPPVMLGSASLLLFTLMGDHAGEYALQFHSCSPLPSVYADSNIHQMHYLFAHNIFLLVMLLEIVYSVGYYIYMMVHSGYRMRAIVKLLRTGGNVPIVNLLYPALIVLLLLAGARLLLGRIIAPDYLVAVTAVFNLFISLVLIVINYFTLYANRSPVTLRTLRSPLSSADSNKHYHYGAEKENAETPIEGMSALSYAELVDGFRALVMVERVYLESSVTIEDVAVRLHSNRTYISCLVSKEFGMSFRDYLGSLRVEHAQKYMKSHPAATQDEVAQASGFSSASTFNKKFRQVVGVSPRQWMVNN